MCNSLDHIFGGSDLKRKGEEKKVASHQNGTQAVRMRVGENDTNKLKKNEQPCCYLFLE